MADASQPLNQQQPVEYVVPAGGAVVYQPQQPQPYQAPVSVVYQTPADQASAPTPAASEPPAQPSQSMQPVASTAKGGLGEDVLLKLATYQRIIYGCAGLSLLMAFVLLGICSHVLGTTDGANVVLPTWALQLGLAFGVIVAFISVAGLWGARSAPDHIENGTRNWGLSVYFLCVFLGLVLELVAGAVLISQLGVLSSASANEYGNHAVASLDSRLDSWCINHPDQWKEVEQTLNCCGYNSTAPSDPTATNPFCPEGPQPVIPPLEPCRKVILDKAETWARVIGALAIVFAGVLLSAFIASMALLCCVSKPGLEYR